MCCSLLLKFLNVRRTYNKTETCVQQTTKKERKERKNRTYETEKGKRERRDGLETYPKVQISKRGKAETREHAFFFVRGV